MPRFLLAFGLCLLCHTTGFSADYILQMETVGYNNVPVSVKDPKEDLQRSLELFVTMDVPFYAKARENQDVVLAKGVLTRAENGNFLIQLKYVHWIGTADQEPEASRNAEFMESTTTISLNEPLPFASSEGTTTFESDGVVVRQSKFKQTLILQLREIPAPN
jgi:hypothetical protein